MKFNTEEIDDVIVVELLGVVLDASNAMEFKSGIEAILGKSCKVVIDMGNVKFIDSSGCGTLLSCLRKLVSLGGDLKLFGVQKPVHTLFELVRMHRIVEIFNTKEEAVKSF